MLRFGFGVVLLAGGAVSCALGSSVAAASLVPLPLRARVLQRGEFSGFTLEAPASYMTAKAWVATGAHPGMTPRQARAEVARLTREGFRGVEREFLDSAQGRGSGLSWVMQLGSAASARAELAAEVRASKAQGQAAETFGVSAVPGAFGFGAAGQGAGGENILFADGPFVYLVGDGWSGSAHNPKHAALIGAATKLYRRVHGHPAGS